MRHDDFFDDDENLCDEDAFSDSLHCLTRSVPSSPRWRREKNRRVWEPRVNLRRRISRG